MMKRRSKPVKGLPTDELWSWWKKYYVGRSQYDQQELERWNEGVTFEDVYNLIRSNGTENPECGLHKLVWNGDYGNVPFARQELYRALARIYGIHGGDINLSWHPDMGLRGAGVDYDNFLKIWIRE